MTDIFLCIQIIRKKSKIIFTLNREVYITVLNNYAHVFFFIVFELLKSVEDLLYRYYMSMK